MARVFREAAESPGFDRAHPFLKQLRGVVKIESGAFADGIELLEAAIELDPEIAKFNDLNFLQLLAFAHQQLGNLERAREVRDYVAAQLDLNQAQGGGRDPTSLMLVAQNHLLDGDVDAALAAFEIAIAGGYPDYYFTLHDWRWQRLRDDPRFETLLMQIKADVDAQRAQIEQADAERNFAARLEALESDLLASPEMDK